MPSRARKSRGMKTQSLVAQWFAAHGWPYAQSTGASRQGVDVTGMLDLAVEVKARTDLAPLAWIKQAEKSADGRLPIVVFRPNGIGEHPEQYLTFLRLGDLTRLLIAAGYGDAGARRGSA